jgi:3-hydroxy-3-methylglutaryl CoA synthase
MNRRVGIEKINIYGSSLFLDMKKLAVARNKDPDRVVKDFLIDTRSLNPPWEDTITMAVNACRDMLNKEDKNDIGMLIAGTEGALDFGKPISTNILGALKLNHNIRNFETKHACYSGPAALDIGINWIASGLNKGKKALIFATDFSREHLGLKEEFVMGGVAAAVLISDNPKVIEFELEKKGTWSMDVYDTFRPSALKEVGNNELSLYTYLDGLEGSYTNYLEQVGEQLDFDTYFAHNIYHTPFAGMAFQAHRTLCNLTKPCNKAFVKESFQKKVFPGLRYARRVGSTYSASNFVGICSLLAGADNLKAGDRISFFAYGSGAIGEFYSALICPEAKEVVAAMQIDKKLDLRKEVTVKEYEYIEKLRNTYIEQANITPDFSILNNWYDKYYKGKGYLVLKQVKDYYRTYEWS